MAAVKQNGDALQHASKELREDRDIVMAAVKKNGRALEYASDELKGDRELVMAAVKQDGFSLQYASDALKGEREVVMEAVRQNRNALRYASEELKSDCVSAAILSETCDDMKKHFISLADPDYTGDFNLINVTGHALIVDLARLVLDEEEEESPAKIQKRR